MKKVLSGILLLLFLIFTLTSCDSSGGKSNGLWIVYLAVAIVSSLLLIGCIALVRKRRFWFILLFSSVLVVNVGYTFLSLATCLEAALWANRISYLGSVLLPLAMLMIILNATNTKYKSFMPYTLLLVALAVFLIAASPGILDIYYKEVSFERVNGVSKLVKVYGVLHPIYLIYLMGYFITMVAVIIRARIKRTVASPAHAIILAIAVFVNIGVWFIEQLVRIDFEMLSVSYIISELFLLGVHLVMTENQRLRDMVKTVESVHNYSESENNASEKMLRETIDANNVDPERIKVFVYGMATLTQTEQAIFEAHIARVTTKEIMASHNIKETTLKYHNRNIYGKLGVSSRKELLELHKYIKTVKSTIE